MARYDKYDGMVGGFRAPLAADWAAAPGAPIAVGLDADGRVVPGAGVTGVLGVFIDDGAMIGGTLTANKKAGDIADVMTAGEIVDNTGLAAGTVYFGDGTAGAIGTDNTDARIGHTVEATRLVVRVVPL